MVRRLGEVLWFDVYGNMPWRNRTLVEIRLSSLFVPEHDYFFLFLYIFSSASCAFPVCCAFLCAVWSCVLYVPLCCRVPVCCVSLYFVACVSYDTPTIHRFALPYFLVSDFFSYFACTCLNIFCIFSCLLVFCSVLHTPTTYHNFFLNLLDLLFFFLSLLCVSTFIVSSRLESALHILQGAKGGIQINYYYYYYLLGFYLIQFDKNTIVICFTMYFYTF